ncbi:MAG: glycosyltransferase family 4 protein [Candidatus Peribacteraceae bacterium]
MKILLTCEDYLPHIGGAEICVLNLRKELRALGHSVSVVTNTTPLTSDEDGIIRTAWSFTPWGIWRNVRALWREIGRHDLVHCQYSFRLAAIAGVLARIRRKPMLLTQQGKGIVPEAGTKFFHDLLISLCKQVSMKSAAFLTSTSDEITDLTAAYVPRSRITLISNGYDADLFQPNPSLPIPPEFSSLPASTKKILSVRRLVPKNGIHIFIQALALLRERRTDFHYFAIGEGRVESYIRQLIDKHGLRENVTLLGKRGNDTLASYYQHADLVVIPSSAEARSIACIEAMGMQKPIIASRVGGLIDLLGKESTYGELVRIYESEACTYGPPDTLSPAELEPLVLALEAFLENPAPLRAKATLARTLVQREYSWKAITQHYVAIYESLLLHR